ncbi:MAG: helix-turn-helix transcriptional regulator [Sciscionella sp.]
MPPVAMGQLAALGLDDDAADVYLRLLTVGASTAEQISHLLGRPTTRICTVFVSLMESGLVSTVTGDRNAVTPIPPGPGLALLTRQRETELERARVATISAFEAFRRSNSGDLGDHLIEAIRGPAIHDRIYQLERGARDTVRAMESPPYYAHIEANGVELENLARGVSYRAVYARAALEQSENLRVNVLPAVKAGEQARTLPYVPVKLFVIDDTCAVVSMSDTAGEAGASALLIRPCSLLFAVIGLFEMCWRAALPLGMQDKSCGKAGTPYLQPSDQRLLALLAAGFSDEQAARSLGVSKRTVYRYLEGLMARTGAENRFQLAVHAARNGWI